MHIIYTNLNLLQLWNNSCSELHGQDACLNARFAVQPALAEPCQQLRRDGDAIPIHTQIGIAFLNMHLEKPPHPRHQGWQRTGGDDCIAPLAGCRSIAQQFNSSVVATAAVVAGAGRQQLQQRRQCGERQRRRSLRRVHPTGQFVGVRCGARDLAPERRRRGGVGERRADCIVKGGLRAALPRNASPSQASTTSTSAAAAARRSAAAAGVCGAATSSHSALKTEPLRSGAGPLRGQPSPASDPSVAAAPRRMASEPLASSCSSWPTSACTSAMVGGLSTAQLEG